MASRTSRKKNKGKERKAKKEADRVEAKRAEAHELWWGWTIGQNNITTITECDHGCGILPEVDHPVISFMDDLISQGISDNRLVSVDSFLDRLQTIHGAPILNNESYKSMTIDILTRIGTNMLLSDAEDTQRAIGASRMAKAIIILENYDGIYSLEAIFHNRGVATKLRDYNDISSITGIRDALKFFSKRTSCSCLNEMHQEARRTLPKMGICYGCNEEKERVALSVCSRCMVTQYCSRECQVANWPKHKADCEIYIGRETGFIEEV